MRQPRRDVRSPVRRRIIARPLFPTSEVFALHIAPGLPGEYHPPASRGLCKRRKRRQRIDAGGRGGQDNSGPTRRVVEVGSSIHGESRVLNLILSLLLIWFVLVVLLAAWTLWFQAYIYSQPVEAIYWRAPAAGTAIAAFLCIWVVLDYRSPQTPSSPRYLPLHDFSARETQRYKYLTIPTPDGKKEQYEWRNNRYQNKAGKGLPSRPLQVIASDEPNGEEHIFEPERDAKGNFVQKDQSLRYYEKGNPKRYMEEGNLLGQITIFHFGWLLMNLILNFGFLIVWFVSLWLLLRFQWSHALGMAVVFWLVMLLFVMPNILKQAEDVARQRAAQSQSQQ